MAVQAPSKRIREGEQRESLNNPISIQAVNGSFRPDPGSLPPRKEGGSWMEVESARDCFKASRTLELNRRFYRN